MSFHQFIKDGPGWETEKRETQYADPHVQLWKVQVRTPSRQNGVNWTVVHRKGGCVIVPMTAKGEFLMVRQERVPIRETIWEFPAGQIDESTLHDTHAIHAAAERELREETGYELAPGGALLPLGHYFSSVGFTDEHSYIFLAKPVAPSQLGQHLDPTEMITECRAFSADQFRAMIASNEIRDANTLCAFARMCAMGLL